MIPKPTIESDLKLQNNQHFGYLVLAEHLDRLAQDGPKLLPALCVFDELSHQDVRRSDACSKSSTFVVLFPAKTQKAPHSVEGKK